MHLNCNGDNETAASPIAMIQLNNGQTTVINVDGANAQEHITPDIFTNDVSESVSITKRESTTIDNTNEFCYSPSWSIHIESDERQQQQERYHHSNRIPQEMDPNQDDAIECDAMASSQPPTLPTSLKFNRNTMSISVKRTAIKRADRIKRQTLQQPPPPPFGRKNVTINEHIICSPLLEHMHNADPNDSDTANGSRTQPSHYGRMRKNAGNSYHNDDLDNGVYDAADNIDGDHVDHGDSSALKRSRDQWQSSRLMELIRTKDQLRSAVVLRSPRGNQPRSYNTDALYSALMDVKAGESIYR